MSDQQVANQGGVKLGRPITVGSAERIVHAPFPKFRTIQWIPRTLPEASVEPDDYSPNAVDIVITQEVLLAVNRHVAQTLERELGGFLLGNRYRCSETGRNYIIIDQYLEADYTEGTEVSLSFTSESWAHLNDRLSGKFMGKALVGWYHSHPKLNVFLSSQDVDIHEGRFREPWKSALVLEPESHQGGFFRWNGDKLDRNNYVEFYELLEGESRETVVAWINFEGIDPQTNKPPTLKRVNTFSDQGPNVYGSGEHELMQSELPEPRKPTRRLSKNPWVWFGILSICLIGVVLLILTLGLKPFRISEVVNQKPAPSPTRTPESTPTPPPRLEDTELGTLQMDVIGVPQIDARRSSINVQLQISDIPGNVVEDVKNGMKVTIDKYDASIELQSIAPDGFTVNASTELKDKIASLTQGHRRQEVTLRASFDHKDNEALIEKLLILDPIVSRGRLAKVEVGVRNRGRIIRRNTRTNNEPPPVKPGEEGKQPEGTTPKPSPTTGPEPGNKKSGTEKKKTGNDDSLLQQIINRFRGKRGKGQ